MKRSVSFVFALFVASLFVSGCMFDSDDDKDVEKGSVSGKVTLTVTAEPVANVKVYLVNADAKVDTVNLADNRRAFVDSAFTGADGRYAIDGIAPGNYSIVPVSADTTAAYRFSLSNDSPSAAFAMNGGSVTANFIAEKINAPGAASDYLWLKIFFKTHDGVEIKGVNSWRRVWCVFVPYWDYLTMRIVGKEGSRYYVSDNWTAGYTAVFYTEENYFRYDVVYTMNGAREECSFNIALPLSGPQTTSEWEYDVLTGALTQLK